MNEENECLWMWLQKCTRCRYDEAHFDRSHVLLLLRLLLSSYYSSHILHCSEGNVAPAAVPAQVHQVRHPQPQCPTRQHNAVLQSTQKKKYAALKMVSGTPGRSSTTITTRGANITKSGIAEVLQNTTGPMHRRLEQTVLHGAARLQAVLGLLP